jgi:hypothetical protein
MQKYFSAKKSWKLSADTQNLTSKFVFDKTKTDPRVQVSNFEAALGVVAVSKEAANLSVPIKRIPFTGEGADKVTVVMVEVIVIEVEAVMVVEVVLATKLASTTTISTPGPGVIVSNSLVVSYLIVTPSNIHTYLYRYIYIYRYIYKERSLVKKSPPPQ